MRIFRKILDDMTLKQRMRRFIQRHIFIYDELDTAGAAQRIKSNIWFRGTNVWILAFSIVIASVGLNVNSTAVIIGAMLVSPLMGPIIGAGLDLGIGNLVNDSVETTRKPTANWRFTIAILAARCHRIVLALTQNLHVPLFHRVSPGAGESHGA